MRKILSSAALGALMLLSLQAPHANGAPSSKDEGGTVVIVFKDGHQQAIPVSAIADLEFKSSAGATTPIDLPAVFIPSRRSFLGKWVVGDGSGGSFTINLQENGEAIKSFGARHGTWTYVNGEARISWDDGWHDAIRKAGSKHEKFAYSPGTSFSDTPANVTEARNTNPQPI